MNVNLKLFGILELWRNRLFRLMILLGVIICILLKIGIGIYVF